MRKIDYFGCMLECRIITLIVSLFYLVLTANGQSFYISNSEGNDDNDGLSIQSPFKSLNKLNSMVFNSGDSIFFKSGDYWQGMFWIKGSGSSMNPIVIGVYGGDNRPIIDGFGYQSLISVLLWQVYIYSLRTRKTDELPQS